MNKLGLIYGAMFFTACSHNAFSSDLFNNDVQLNKEVGKEQSAITQASLPDEEEQSSLSQDNGISKATKDLKNKLAKLQFFSAEFSQKIIMESGEVIQENKGKLALSKPNSLYWETYTPDELYIIAKDDDVWFFNPWIDEASVYNVSTATAKTPLLLLTSTDDDLWDQYYITEQVSADASTTAFVISSKEENSQVQSLTLSFKVTDKGDELTTFAFLDATGQTSMIILSEFDKTTAPVGTLFDFVVPTGVSIKDHRSQ